MQRKKILQFTVVIFAFLMAGCEPEPYNQGNLVDTSVIKGKEGIWGRKEVEQAIGSPSFTDPHSSFVVYYVGAKGYKYPIMAPTIQKKLTLRIEYNENGRLKNFSLLE